MADGNDPNTWIAKGKELTKNYEGFRSSPYKDTKGIKTIGYGFNMQANKGLPSQMDRPTADKYFDSYYTQAANTAQMFAGDRWGKLDDNQKAILADMAYNMHNKLFGFKNMQADLQSGDNAGVQKEMQNSNWFNQVGQRGVGDVSNWK